MGEKLGSVESSIHYSPQGWPSSLEWELGFKVCIQVLSGFFRRPSCCSVDNNKVSQTGWVIKNNAIRDFVRGYEVASAVAFLLAEPWGGEGTPWPSKGWAGEADAKKHLSQIPLEINHQPTNHMTGFILASIYEVPSPSFLQLGSNFSMNFRGINHT